MPYYILSNILYRVLEPYIITLILLKMMYRISIFDLFDSLFKGAQNLYSGPEKRKSCSVLVWQANALSQEIRILKNFTLDHSNIRTITILQ